ncbi:MAG TPA: metallophosphoesterase [Kofleriaceae bacterium]
MRVVVCLCVLAGVAGAAPHMVKGPYLQNVAPDAITIMWELDQPVPATLVVTGPGGRTIEATADHIAEVRVDKLTPATRYHYRVTIGDAHWDGEFATAPPLGADVPFSFVVFGDSRNGIEQHRRVLDRVVAEAPTFVLATGDMVDEGYNEDQWQAFFDVEEKLMKGTVLFPALGNHDRQGRGRTADTYRAYFAVPENGGDPERYYAFTYASARFVVLDSNSNSFSLTDQTAWLERELIATRQDPSIRHIFIVMHHPPFSVSLHGGAVDLRERWVPLFEKYQVSAVFSGHDHVYERAEHDGIHYFVSGGAGAPLYPRRPAPNPVDADAVVAFERTLHYLRVNVTSDRVEVTAVRADGTVIETTSWADGPSAPVASEGGVPIHRIQAVGARSSQGTVAAEPSPHRWWLVIVGGLLAIALVAGVVRVSRKP